MIFRAPDLVPVVSDRCETVYWESTRQEQALEPYPGGILGHARHGIVLMHGPGIRSNHRLPDADIADITPTVLHLQGLPPAADHDGTVIRDAFAGTHLAGQPTTAVDSYMKYRVAATPHPDTGDSETHLKTRLEALGYIR